MAGLRSVHDTRWLAVNETAAEGWRSAHCGASSNGGQVEDQDWKDAALRALLEALSTAAFIADGAGRVVLTNRWGRNLLQREPETVHGWIHHGLAGTCKPPLEAQLLAPSSRTPHCLVVQRQRPAGFEERVALAQERWGLTRRQVEVLRCLAQGMSNKATADLLAVSQKTTELHVTTLLQKVGVSSRSEVVAEFWRLAEQTASEDPPRVRRAQPGSRPDPI